MGKNILFLHYTDGESCRKMLKGAQRYATTKKEWALGVIENCKNIPSIRKLLGFWKPDGCIADCGGIGGAFKPRDFGKTPIVMLNRSGEDPDDGTPSILHGQRETARLAAQEILRLGRSSLAFVGWIKNTMWSRAREEELLNDAHLNGYEPRVFHAWQYGKEETSEIQPQLRRFLEKTPLPTAVFAANDRMAREVLAASRAIGISVPYDLAVVGIDNNEMVTLSENPTLTTVEIDFESAGFSAAEMLDKMFTAPNEVQRKRFFGPLRLIRRGSTSISQRKDSLVDEARDYIIRHCAEGISAIDVAARFPCSRRMAEIRFRAATGRSIGEEILDARMDIVKGYLATSHIGLDALANLSGWKSSAVLRQYFKRKTGMSLSAWRSKMPR